MSFWDTPIKSEPKKSEYKVAKEGTYEFQVERVTGKEYVPGPSSKIGRCAEIDLQLRVETPEGDIRVFDRLYSDPLTIWRMTAFAKCVGIFAEFMTPGDLLNKANGTIGKAFIKYVPAKGEWAEKNEVGRYLEPETAPDNSEELPF